MIIIILAKIQKKTKQRFFIASNIEKQGKAGYDGK